MKILMIGSTGTYAKLIIPALKKKGIHIKALVRQEGKTKEAIANGADEAVMGNLNDTESLQKAVQNVDGVFHLNPVFTENEEQLGLNMVQAANKANVDKFVFSGVYHPSLSLSNHTAKRPVEEALYESDMDFIILQPAMFMQNIGHMWPVIKKTKKLTMPFSKFSQMSYVDYRDVAEVIAIAFTEERLNNGTFELSSEGTYSRVQVANMMSKILNTEIEAREISFEDFSTNIGLTDGFAKEGLKAMFNHYDQYGLHGGNALVLETILDRKPNSLQEFFRDLEGN